MRWSRALAVLLVLPLTAGCLDAFDQDREDDPHDAVSAPADVGYDAAKVSVTGVIKESFAVTSFDGTSLSTILYRPTTDDNLSDGSPVPWGVVVFLHGWGFFKEQFTGAEGQGAPAQAAPVTGQVPYGPDRLMDFASQGVIAVAYDARGFGQSTGTSTVAGPAELADLRAVLDHVAATYVTSGRVGLIGTSYGGGQAFQAWADDPRVVTAVPMYGWVDLYEGLLQGGVPKAQWGVSLTGVGAIGGKGPNPLVADWVERALTRSDLAGLEAEMDLRSALGRLPQVAKPLLLCQGLQETLFPQADLAWDAAGGFTRAIVSTGGHGTDDEVCWSHALDWMLHFVAGHDKGVGAWPALQSVDASGAPHLSYAEFPRPEARVMYLGTPGDVTTSATNATFTVEQRVLANPLVEPSTLWDNTAQPYQQVPEQFRDDPSAVFFQTPPLKGSEVLLGAPVVRLHLADPANTAGYQVTGTLYHLDCGGDPACARGKSRVLSHAAAADGADAGDAVDPVLELRFWWTKADLNSGDRIVLKLGANDPSVWLPFPSNYAVDFTGASELELPFFVG